MDAESAAIAARLGAQVRGRRHAKGWSQAQLAEAIEVEQHFVSLIERGQKLPSIKTLVRLGAALGVSVGELFGQEAVNPAAAEIATLVAGLPIAFREPLLAFLRVATVSQTRVGAGAGEVYAPNPVRRRRR